MFKKISVFFLAMIMFSVASCGTIMKDGKGGSSSQLDPTIVILDAVGLLFFIIPGVVAFVLDFNNKTIYK